MKKIITALLITCLTVALSTACEKPDIKVTNTVGHTTSIVSNLPQTTEFNEEKPTQTLGGTAAPVNTLEPQVTQAVRETPTTVIKTAIPVKTAASNKTTAPTKTKTPVKTPTPKPSPTPEAYDKKFLNIALHDIAITMKVKKDYDTIGKPTVIRSSDGKDIAIIRYYDNGSLDYIKTDSNTLIAHRFSRARIMCDYSVCPDSETALMAVDAIAGGTYDFTNNTSGVKAYLTALTKDTTLDAFRNITNNNNISEDLLLKMKSLLGGLQTGAIIYDKASNGALVGKYVFINPAWFTADYPIGTYYCIDPDNENDFGKDFTASYSTSYMFKP